MKEGPPVRYLFTIQTTLHTSLASPKAPLPLKYYNKTQYQNKVELDMAAIAEVIFFWCITNKINVKSKRTLSIFGSVPFSQNTSKYFTNRRALQNREIMTHMPIISPPLSLSLSLSLPLFLSLSLSHTHMECSEVSSGYFLTMTTLQLHRVGVEPGSHAEHEGLFFRDFNRRVVQLDPPCLSPFALSSTLLPQSRGHPGGFAKSFLSTISRTAGTNPRYCRSSLPIISSYTCLREAFFISYSFENKHCTLCEATAPRHLQLAIQLKKDWTMTCAEQFVILSKRTFRERCSDYLDKLRLLQAIGVAVLLGLLWWKSKIETEAQLRDQIGLMFYICIFWTSASLFGAVYVFPYEKSYLVKERKADMYRLSVYYVCSTLCDMVAHVFYPTIFMVIIYFMADFKRTVPCFFSMLASVLLIVITSQLFGAAILSIKRAGLMASLVLMLFILTGGYYVQHIPIFMRWLKYVSFMHFGFRLMLKAQYSGDEPYECGGPGGCRRLQSSPSFDTVNLAGGVEEVWILLAMALAYRLLAFFCLRRRISAAPC
ncbi:unnamed protein product [Spirodela intermedia]|uniref:ABC-2 type transporter transmembrane domain-containing protein n=1 Tax=Spirodela intermedia TaxID=51605 RepID=A0A7I8IWL5_SPIIN|nr:unnamed protein product [Spirodela intermedia]CAA6661531.1 unnamed protein product [Spirodela intermedia]